MMPAEQLADTLTQPELMRLALRRQHRLRDFIKLGAPMPVLRRQRQLLKTALLAMALRDMLSWEMVRP